MREKRKWGGKRSEEEEGEGREEEVMREKRKWKGGRLGEGEESKEGKEKNMGVGQEGRNKDEGREVGRREERWRGQKEEGSRGREEKVTWSERPLFPLRGKPGNLRLSKDRRLKVTKLVSDHI